MTDDANAPTVPEAPTSSPSPPRAPDPRYALRGLLGRGGMGEVWLAHDARIDRDIAIKMMRGDGNHDPDTVARFLREARVQGRLEHPSVVPVHDLGGDAGSPYFAMKRLSGTTLADVLEARAAGDHGAAARWSRRTLLGRLVEVCLAVEFAHQRGVIHRDLKPANLMLGDFGETYVLDWGLARIAGASDAGTIRTADLRSDSGSGGQTVAGTMLGTPGYMAPEQMRGEAIDQRTDVYALGCILFEILAGEPAVPRGRVQKATLATTLAPGEHRPAARRPDAEIPPELDDACARATTADPAARLASARALADGIQRFLDGDRDLARRRRLAATHATRATRAFATPSIEGRAEAMREAGRAIALDPGNGDAQRVLALLLLQPPLEIPPEARRKIDEERQRATQTVLRAGAIVYLVFFAIAAVVKLSGVPGVWQFALLLGELAANAGLCAWASRKPRPVSRAMFTSLVGLHVAMLATLGLFLGPLLLLPILIFGFLPIALMTPAARFPVVCLVLHALALAVPLVLEWLGVVRSSYHLVGNSLVLEPWLELPPRVLMFTVLMTIAGQLVANTVLLDSQRRSQDRAQEQVHVQAWQLAQLVT